MIEDKRFSQLVDTIDVMSSCSELESARIDRLEEQVEALHKCLAAAYKCFERMAEADRALLSAFIAGGIGDETSH